MIQLRNYPSLNLSSIISRPKILLADDEWLLRWSLERHLTRLGSEVHTVATGAEAIRLLEVEKYDWLITDLKLPEKDGFDLISAAKKAMPGIQTILMTAYGSSTVEAKAHKLGAIYIAKPFDLDTIAHLVRPVRTVQS